MDLYIYVNTGYSLRRIEEDPEALEDYENNLPEDLTVRKHIYERSQELLKKHPVLFSVMNQSRDDEMVYMIKNVAAQNKIKFDDWNPIFRCQNMLQALTVLPKIVKICRKIDWCNIWDEQDFDDMKIFVIDEKTYVFLNLEAESG